MAASAKAQVKVESSLDSMKILIGGQVNLRVSVTANPDAHIEFPAYKPMQNIAQDIEIVDVGNDTLEAENKMQIFSKVYTLTSWNEGKYNIPAQSVKVNGKSYITNSIPLTVETIQVDTTSTSQIKPAKDVQDNPFSWRDWEALFWMSLAVILILMLIYYLKLRLGENKPVISRIRFIKRLLPHQKALKAIEQIKEEQLAHSEDQKVYYTRLTDTLRSYLEERFGFNAKEMTSSDIISRLRAEEDKSKIEELKEVFETADLVKFAKYSTQANMNDMYLDNVVKFIDDTKQEGAPTVEKIDESLTHKEKCEARDRKIIEVGITILTIITVAIFAYMAWLVYELLS